MKNWENTVVTEMDIADTFTNGFGADRVQINEQDDNAVIYTVYGTSRVETCLASKHNSFDCNVRSDMTLERVYEVKSLAKRLF